MREGEVRRLSLDDYDDLLSLWQRAGLHSIEPQGRDSRAALAQQLASGVTTILGLEVDGRLVGAVIATHDSRKGWINRLAIDPRYRRQGYGMRLVDAAEGTLLERGMSVIAALVVGHNRASLALFQKAGYADAGPAIHYLRKRRGDSARQRGGEIEDEPDFR